MARALIEKGFNRVRPLEGGLDAWVEAGRDVEEGEWEELLVAVRKVRVDRHRREEEPGAQE